MTDQFTKDEFVQIRTSEGKYFHINSIGEISKIQLLFRNVSLLEQVYSSVYQEKGKSTLALHSLKVGDENPDVYINI